MITKAKLLNGYIDVNDKELKALFTEACAHYGITTYSQDTLKMLEHYSALRVSGDGKHIVRAYRLGNELTLADFKPKPKTKVELTLADFKPKPKTKVEYVKVDSEEAAHWLTKYEGDIYLKNIITDSYFTVDLQGYIDQMRAGGDVVIYRKIEKEITWRDNIADSNLHVYIYESDKAVTIDRMPEGKFIEICHLVSEANK